MATFTGKLNSNEIFASLFNMLISQQVFADNIKGTYSSLVDSARVDGSMAGDTKLYYSTDILQSYEWGNDAEAENLLKLYRPKAPEVQSITLDVFRQIPLTVDNYLSKRAWGTESSFSDFNSVMLGWIRNTKKVYDSLTYNCYIGTCNGNQIDTIDVSSAVAGLTGNEKNRVEAQVIAEYISQLLANMSDITRSYNGYGYMRSYSPDELAFVWNTDAIAKIEKRDLPTIFNKEIMEKFGEYKLPGRYFGNACHDFDYDGNISRLTNVTVKGLFNEEAVKKITVSAFEDGVLVATDLGPFYFMPIGTKFSVVNASGTPIQGLENLTLKNLDENLGGALVEGYGDTIGEITTGSYLSGVTDVNMYTLKALREVTASGKDSKNNAFSIHLFPGDSIASGFKAAGLDLTSALGYTFDELTYGDCYIQDDSILFKVIHKGPASVPFMSAFEVATSFFNPKSLTETHYLTWGHNTLDYLKEFPFITVKQI